jgi:hypothetical protein
MPFFKQSSQRRPSRHVFVSIEGIQQTGVVAAAEAVQAVFAPFAGGGCSDDGGGSLVVTPGPDPHGRLWWVLQWLLDADAEPYRAAASPGHGTSQRAGTD